MPDRRRDNPLGAGLPAPNTACADERPWVTSTALVLNSLLGLSRFVQGINRRNGPQVTAASLIVLARMGSHPRTHPYDTDLLSFSWSLTAIDPRADLGRTGQGLLPRLIRKTRIADVVVAGVKL